MWVAAKSNWAGMPNTYFFNYKKLFLNLYFDRVDNTFARLRESGDEFFDPKAQLE